MNDILIADYNPQWPRLFDELRQSVWSAVAAVALSIEHVGSTAVPGLAAKPVIDMDVVVPNDRVLDGIARLTGLGYVHRGDQGIPEREAFERPAGSPRHHLYLCPASSAALMNHLAVRHYLRTHAGDAAAYGNLKKRLAREFAGDLDGYVQAKTDFLTAVLRNAGFPEGHLAAIEQMNRAR